MQQQLNGINHPLPLETKITASKPSCPCKNASYETVTGIIKKVITNQSGYWYYLDIGMTIRGIWITAVN